MKVRKKKARRRSQDLKIYKIKECDMPIMKRKKKRMKMKF